MKTKKSKGARFMCSEVTMNGWLRLCNDEGWILIVSYSEEEEGYTEVVMPIWQQEEPLLAIERHMSQGICCLEVVFKAGVPVRKDPDRRAPTLATKRKGEYVFADAQNFDGWIKLAGEEGWMMVFCPEWGDLLRPRKDVSNIELWSLCDAWSCARRRPGSRVAGLTDREMDTLKELESRMDSDAGELLEKCGAEPRSELLYRGVLRQEDLKVKLSNTALRRRVFAHLLSQTACEGEDWLRELLPDFQHSWPPRVPPLPEADEFESEEEEESDDGWYAPHREPANWGEPMEGLGAEGLGPDFDALDPDSLGGMSEIELDGRKYAMGPNGVLFDPPNQVPIGIWNPTTSRIDPALGQVPGTDFSSICYGGRAYLLMDDNSMIDPDTQVVVGYFDRDMCAIIPANPWEPEIPLIVAEPEIPLFDPAFNDDEPVHPSEYLERGRLSAKKEKYKAAACLFEAALKGCAKQRLTDLEFEAEILHARCECWLKTKSYRELLEDADRVLDTGGCTDPAILADLQKWRAIAVEALADQPANSAAAVGGETTTSSGAAASAAADGDDDAAKPELKCVQCNGLAKRCSACGKGMESCGNCGKPVGQMNCCSRCYAVYYCDRDCQRTHWKDHKRLCRKAVVK